MTIFRNTSSIHFFHPSLARFFLRLNLLFYWWHTARKVFKTRVELQTGPYSKCDDFCNEWARIRHYASGREQSLCIVASFLNFCP
ncbi:hypothetical protein BJX63DRAFT_19639 [Aspergillus granulosus]|uniref:Secreted protein n=1 Tax=Aspergillus granulosus TaxID=176169 RepID=A0ABR4H006_9EURO